MLLIYMYAQSMSDLTIYGTEKLEVARYMPQARGLNCRSHITGLSTYNQRIERLWCDVRQCVTIIFSKLGGFSVM